MPMSLAEKAAEVRKHSVLLKYAPVGGHRRRDEVRGDAASLEEDTPFAVAWSCSKRRIDCGWYFSDFIPRRQRDWASG